MSEFLIIILMMAVSGITEFVKNKWGYSARGTIIALSALVGVSYAIFEVFVGEELQAKILAFATLVGVGAIGFYNIVAPKDK